MCVWREVGATVSADRTPGVINIFGLGSDLRGGWWWVWMWAARVGSEAGVGGHMRSRDVQRCNADTTHSTIWERFPQIQNYKWRQKQQSSCDCHVRSIPVSHCSMITPNAADVVSSDRHARGSQMSLDRHAESSSVFPIKYLAVVTPRNVRHSPSSLVSHTATGQQPPEPRAISNDGGG